MGAMGQDRADRTSAQERGERVSPGWRLLVVLTLIAALALRVRAFSLYDIAYSDELLQYLEQANRFVTGHGVVPWEWRVGLRNALIPQVLALPVWLGHALGPGTMLPVALARAAFLALNLLVLPAAYRLGALHSRAAALVALFAVSVWWESVLFSELMLAESLGAALMLPGAALLLDRSASRRALVLSGLLLGLAVLVRMQYAVFAGVLALAALRVDRGRWVPVMLGGLAALLVGAASDLAAGLPPFGWVVVGISKNIGEGIAARFGTSPPLAYLGMLQQHLWPVFAPALAGAVLAGRRYRPLMLAALANLIVHSLIGHKECRFVWLTTLTIVILSAIALVRLADWLANRRGQEPGSLRIAVLLCGAIALLSAFSATMTGGASAWRGGGAIPRLAGLAAQDPKVCGIAIAYEFKSHVVPALLPRRVPLMLAPEGVLSGNRPLSPGLAAAADALVLNADTPVPQQYERRACLPLAGDSPCLFVRPGTCTQDTRDSYQQAIARNDM